MHDAPQLMDEINRATWRKKANRHLSAFGSNTLENGDDTSEAWWLHYVARKA